MMRSFKLSLGMFFLVFGGLQALGGLKLDSTTNGMVVLFMGLVMVLGSIMKKQE